MLALNIWQRALRLYQEAERRREHLGRIKLADTLQIPERQARELLFALENREMISMQPDTFNLANTELVFADLHIPYQDDIAISAMFDFIESQHIKPDLVVILGDLVDFYEISTFSKDPRRKDIAAEIKEANEFLISLRNRYPDARMILYRGNHCERMERYIFKQAPQLADLTEGLLEDKLGLSKLNIEYVIDPFCIGRLWHLHGHERTGGSYNVEYITNVLWGYILDNFVAAHFHRSQQKIFKSIDNNVYWTGVVGYLAKELDWARLNKWTSGFGIVWYDTSGNFRAELKTILHGEVY
jgi:hypothetical protein